MESFIEEKEDCACYAGQPIDNAKEDLLEALKEAFEEMVSERADKLIENNPEDYVCGTSDCGYENFGCGYVKLNEQYEYDEDQAYEDAKEEIISELVNNEEDAPYYLFENNKFTIALGKFLKGC